MPAPAAAPATSDTEYDFIIVGSGAGGGPLAANLARNKYRVLLLEAGDWDDPLSAQVPALHPLSTEDKTLSWEFFIRHYTDDRLQRQDTKWVNDKGIFYPRAATVGGCTVHNAMITIAGPPSDWNEIADLTGDESWSDDAMRFYFQRLERCMYQPRPTTIVDPSRHGFDGWLATSWPDLRLALGDRQLVKLLKAVFKATSQAGIDTPWLLKSALLHGRIREQFDPNFWRAQWRSPEGIALVPTAVQNGKRCGPRDLLRQTQQDYGEYLTIQPLSFVVKILFDRSGPRPRAVGVKLRRGKKIYKAHQEPEAWHGEEVEIRCRREVILCGGAFNTPQLLMLSGIGPRDELRRHGIEEVVDLPGVGKNLQDRYEVGVIYQMSHDFSLLADAAFQTPGTVSDPALERWQRDGKGVYASNGVVVGIFKRSRPVVPEPDQFFFALPGYFKGYEPGYSNKVGEHKNKLTWAILKAHTNNHAGDVRLRSADPLEPPQINFRFFGDGDEGDPDLDAVVDGVRFVRQIMKHVAATEVWPPPGCDTDDQVRDWIRREAWGHHAAGTCRIGKADDANAVVDSRFRVRNVDGLRIVDASIFPTIPGLFIVTNIYMASEKASDVIDEDARGGADNALYPRRLANLEAEALHERRRLAGAPQADGQPDRTVGLALSGGGIRSATFNLGILQALAKQHALGTVDYLSTVSGGGYVGSFLGALYSRLGQDAITAPQAPALAEATLTDPASKPLTWLRKNANFLSPTGKGNIALDLGVYLRSFLTLHFVLLVFFFAWYGLANLLRYWAFPELTHLVESVPLLPIQVSLPGPDDLPFGHMLFAGLGDFWSPWVMFAEIILLVWTLPQALGFWLASQDRPGRFQPQALVVFFILAGGLLFYGLYQAGAITLRPLFAILPFLVAFFWVERAWRWTELKIRASGGTTPPVQASMARNYLTRWLGQSLGFFGFVVLFVLIDTVGYLLYHSAQAESNHTGMSAKLGAMLVALLPALRLAAGLVGQPRKSPPSSLRRKILGAVVPIVLFLVVVFLLGVLVSYFAHLAFDGGHAIVLGLALTVTAFVISEIFSYAIRLINRTSLQAVYAARLCRTFLGATNSRRAHHPLGMSILETMPGDEVSFRDYKPHTAGGPIHLINIMLNHTIDWYSERGVRDRHGDNFAVSPFGLSAGADVHALWGPAVGQVIPLPTRPGKEHPFQGAEGTEELTLSEWMAISGAAISAGQGRHTNIGASVLLGLANLRTGYWWHSGRRSSAHANRPQHGRLMRWRETIARHFWPQSLLLYELLGRFGGPWVTYWYLSDAGAFENLGVYELLRRRVPCIICCDAGMDPAFRMDDLGELVLKARVDFQAEFEFLKHGDIQANAHIPEDVKPHLGELDDLRPTGHARLSKKHAALARVTYQGDPARASMFLYIKSSLTGDEPIDVVSYRANHPEFPHEPTADQFFTEPQWESYRKLGEIVGSRLLLKNASGHLWIMHFVDHQQRA